MYVFVFMLINKTDDGVQCYTTRLVDLLGWIMLESRQRYTTVIHGDNLQISLYFVVNDENMENTRTRYHVK